MRLSLQFAPEQGELHRARLGYAFRLFCAIYGHQPLFADADRLSADLWLSYRPVESASVNVRAVRLGRLYNPRSLRESAAAPTPYEANGEKIPLFYRPDASGEPDWLAEIFEWVSCADEYSRCTRDTVGRLPFSDSYCGRHQLDPCRPYAAVAMNFLQRSICELLPRTSLAPESPSPGVRHFVVNTHDVDFLPNSRMGSIRRLLKNAAISLLMTRSLALAGEQVRKAVQLAAGSPDPFDQVSTLARRERDYGAGATLFFLTARKHRRDGNYPIDSAPVRILMSQLHEQDREIGVHGSYTSLDEPARLREEFDSLRRQGFEPMGVRQHWLRFTLDHLIPAVEAAGGIYDSSLGWADRIGFRAGACFPFPPYYFAKERPARFLELPLAIMESCLLNPPGNNNNEDFQFGQAAKVLAISRGAGWGGLALLWHPSAFGGTQLPESVGAVFWRLLKSAEIWQDTWVSARELVTSVGDRFARAGLLPQNALSESA